jgi:hypothetical protein
MKNKTTKTMNNLNKTIFIICIVAVLAMALLTSFVDVQAATIQNDHQVNFVTGGYYLSEGGFNLADTNNDGYVILWMVGDKLVLTTDNGRG